MDIYLESMSKMGIYLISVPKEYRYFFVQCAQKLILDTYKHSKNYLAICPLHLYIARKYPYSDCITIRLYSSDKWTVFETTFIKSEEYRSKYESIVENLTKKVSDCDQCFINYKLHITPRSLEILNIFKNFTALDVANILDSDLKIASKYFIWE